MQRVRWQGVYVAIGMCLPQGCVGGGPYVLCGGCVGMCM